jgi:tRNA (adenine57-N1/adenine58-N1)-methyltransferase
MSWNLNGTHACDGDLVQLVGLRHKNFLFSLRAGAEFQSHKGIIYHDDIIGKPWGSAVTSHNGSPFFMMPPSLGDILKNIKHGTQTLYPKDIGYIFVTMGIGPGQHVLEAGTGSGALTTAFAYAVGAQGHVTSYESREEFSSLAQANLQKIGLEERVTFKVRDILDGLDETGVDAVFLDLPNPWDYLLQVLGSLKPGGYLGSILPTTNQVSLFLKGLRANHFAFIDVCEVLLRFYRPDPERLRPVDRMVAHTGFLIFARPVIISTGKVEEELIDESLAGNPIDDDD